MVGAILRHHRLGLTQQLSSKCHLFFLTGMSRSRESAVSVASVSQQLTAALLDWLQRGIVLRCLSAARRFAYVCFAVRLLVAVGVWNASF